MYGHDALRQLTHDHRRELDLDARRKRLAVQARPRQVRPASESPWAAMLGRALAARRYAT